MKIIHVFDLDDTLVHTTAKMWVCSGDYEFALSNEEFNDYELKPEEHYDYKEFNDAEILCNEQVTSWFMYMKKIFRSGGDVCILSAREDPNMIKSLLDKHKLQDFPIDMIFCIGDPDKNYKIEDEKAKIIKKLQEQGYTHFWVYDDNEKNLNTISLLSNDKMKIFTIKI